MFYLELLTTGISIKKLKHSKLLAMDISNISRKIVERYNIIKQT